TQNKAHIQKGLSLMEAAIEGVRNASERRMTTQILQNAILRPAHVQNDRQVVPLCQSELFLIKALLLFLHVRLFELRDEQVKAYFADPNKTGVIQCLFNSMFQSAQIVL